MTPCRHVWKAVATAAFMGLAARGTSQETSIPAKGTLLSSTRQVFTLTTNDLASGQFRAQFRGCVIYVSTPARRLYVQQDGQAIQVDLPRSVESFKPGHIIDVSGPVVASAPVPRVINAEVTIAGEGPQPEAPPYSAHHFLSGKDFFRLVTVRGFVRDMSSERTSMTLLLTADGLPYHFTLPMTNAALPRHWIDAEIELVGFCYPYFDGVGRPNGFRFYAQDTNSVRVIRPGRSELFDLPLMTIAEASALPKNWGPRVKIAGTVTFHRGVDLYIQDETGVMHMNLIALVPRPVQGNALEHDVQSELQPGERVEVIGVRHNWYYLAPMLLHAEFRRTGRGPEVKPVEVSYSDLRAGHHAGELVTLVARLADHRSWGTSTTRRRLLVMQAGDDIFQANWSGDDTPKWDLNPNSYVRVTGVNEAQGGQFKHQCTFELRLRSPADIVAAAAPPFWERPGMRKPLLTGIGVGGVALAFIFLQGFHMRRLEKRVALRTADLRDANARLLEEVSARERAEDELRVALVAEKDLNQLKSSFVSMVSHEFRTPLEIILSSSHILDRYLDRLPPEKRREQLRAIRKSVHRMSDLMEDVLTLGKFEAARMTCSPVPVDLAAFCRRCVDEIESATSSSSVVKLTAIDLNGGAVADEGLLSHILTNLLSNAVKYSPPGKTVDFTVCRRGADAEFVVRDSGCGIPPADQARLFTAFHRAGNVSHIAGSGLGLVIVRRCVELHGGNIAFESAEGLGTTFTVTLPLFDGTRIFRRETPAVINSSPAKL
jgi:signal transduction histidine kinase